jgi:hypothetical protein
MLGDKVDTHDEVLLIVFAVKAHKVFGDIQFARVTLRLIAHPHY